MRLRILVQPELIRRCTRMGRSVNRSYRPAYVDGLN